MQNNRAKFKSDNDIDDSPDSEEVEVNKADVVRMRYMKKQKARQESADES